MRSFLAAYERGTLQGAARALQLSQPTLTRHIAALETALGVMLFERTGRGLLALPAAEHLAGPARAMAAAADAALRGSAGSERKLAGEVKISASQAVANFVLPKILSQLRAQEPEIHFTVVSTNAVSNLLRREADIAIRMTAPKQSSLLVRKAGAVEIGAFAARSYVKRFGAPESLRDLAGHDLVGYEAGSGMEDMMAKRGLDPARLRFALRSADHVLVYHAIKAGLGVGFLAAYAAADEGLVRVAPLEGVMTLPVWLAVHREIATNRRIRRVYDFLAAHLAPSFRA